jgi:hypothetical protein
MSIQQVKLYDTLSSLDLVAPNLWTVDSCFDQSTFQWLKDIVETEGNEFVAGALKKRLQLRYNMQDQVRLNEIGLKQKSALSEIAGCDLEFMESKYWLDLPQFGCQVHNDAPDLYVNYQIYIYTSPGADAPCVGAEFLHVDPPYLVDFKPNYGYININSDLKKHWVYGGHAIRTSVMFQYARV